MPRVYAWWVVATVKHLLVGGQLAMVQNPCEPVRK
jgi:hypothetical protein